ncbi:hypothetical protein LCGC14_0464660 [marine sediment metagenome]|uniref:Uncharacterized protein n=1 Tax=marine sediment metagenome TaxID=412755 RepID=A0A0F9SJ82_9ZZZZ
MVLETYFFAGIIIASVFMIAGFRSTTPHPKWLIISAGAIFLVLGLLIQTDGIDREVNYTLIRNEFDQNRVSDINVTTEIIRADASNEIPPVGVRFDKGLWMISQLFQYILGWGNILIGFFLMVTGYMREFKEGN